MREIRTVQKSPRLSFDTAKTMPPPFTQIDYYLVIVAVITMQVIYWTHRQIPEDAGWAQYAVYMTIFAVVGFMGTQLIYGEPPLPKRFAPIDLNTGVKAVLILAAAMATQIAVQTALSLSITEQAMYFVFAAVCEEIFFRVLILSVGFKVIPKAEELWFKAERSASKADAYRLKGEVLGRMLGFLVLQAVLFAAIHQNYYENLPMLLSVLIGGLVLGVFFVWWRNPTANILAHFLLNIIAVQNLLVVLAAMGV
jgi:membrane protease YdiL (CAAX protease family)